MFCNKCGKEISDGVKFCTECGAECGTGTSYANNTVANGNANQQNQAAFQSNYNSNNNQSTAVYEDLSANDTGNNQQNSRYTNQQEQVADGVGIVTENKPEKKKMGKGKIIAIIASAVAVLTIVGFFVWRPLLYALAPEKYVGMLLKDTFDDVIEDYDDIQENIIGFVVKSDENFTIGGTLDIKHDYDEGMKIKADAKLANNADAKELAGTVDFTIEAEGEKVSGNAQAYLNDSQIGAGVDIDKCPDEVNEKIEKFNGKDFVVPSPNFGEALVKSDIGDELSSDEKDMVKGLDLSYSKLFNKETGEKAEELLDIYKEVFIEFLGKCKMSDRKSIDFQMGEDEVSAKEITVTVTAKDFLEFYIDLLEETKNSGILEETYGDSAEDMLDPTIEEMENTLDKYGDDLEDEEADISLIEYSGRIVGIVIEIEGEELKITFPDKKHILNGMVVELEDEFKLEFEANWASEDSVIFANLKVVNHYGEDEKKIIKGEMEFNFDSGKFSAALLDDGKEVIKVKGKCSKGDKFNLTIDNIYSNGKALSGRSIRYVYSVEYDEWFNDSFVDSYEAESMYEDHIRGEKYNELRRAYMRDSNYSSFIEWYKEQGEAFDSDYESYDSWLESAYDDYNVEELYQSDAGIYEDIEYDITVKVSLSISQTADVKIKKRDKIKVFDLTMDELESYFGGGSQSVEVRRKESETATDEMVAEDYAEVYAE
ncbi:MAG: zinc ribbon domain-containing protein [Ruminococcaceae bacterium]|nr:zinc ribbon domain-containing protein [Oscillospiraceae bacterium]